MIVTRSFSKIHGLAGLRIGYGIAAASTAATLRSHASSGGVNIVAARAAEAALEDIEHVRACVSGLPTSVRSSSIMRTRECCGRDSLTNFVMLNTGRPSEQVVDHFAKHRVLVAGSLPGFDNYIRVSIGTPQRCGSSGACGTSCLAVT